jgi:hypothetical protein
METASNPILDAVEPASVSEQEELRLATRERVLSSTFLFARLVLQFGDLTQHTHGPVCSVLDSPHPRKLIVFPRDHLKTSIATIADTCRRIAKNPNIRILLGNETATNAGHFVRRIAAVFDRNETFRWLFPELIEDPNSRRKWSEAEILVPRSEDHPESTVEAIGVGGAVVSRHYDLVKLDDLVGKEASESDEVMRKTLDWYDYVESLLHHPEESEVHVIGTRWAYHDLVDKIIKTERDSFHVLQASAIGPQGQALWPERFNAKTLDRIRRKIGTWKFSCQYLNNPHDPEASSFDPKWLKFATSSGDDVVCPRDGASARISEMRKFTALDPAISDKDQACNSAIAIVGVDHLFRKWLLKVWAKRVQPIKLIDMLFALCLHYDCESIGLESVAFQRALRFFITQEMERRGQFLNVIELKTSTRQSKNERIRGLQPYFERGEIYVVDRDDPGMRQFVDEYKGFPTGSLVDTLDAISYLPQLWEAAADPNEATEEDEERSNMKFSFEGRSTVTGY